MVEMVEILNGRVGKCLVERVRYVINNLLHLVFVKYFHSPSARNNSDPTREISHHITR